MRLKHAYEIRLDRDIDFVKLTIDGEEPKLYSSFRLEMTPLQAEALVASLTEFVGSKEAFK